MWTGAHLRTYANASNDLNFILVHQFCGDLELRAALSLSRLASLPDAHQLLSEVVGRITEGHDTADLRAARAQVSLTDSPTDD